MFDEKTKLKINNYVYALFIDGEKHPFYIGKGTGNRLFDHVRCAVDIKYEDIKSLKYDKIRQHENKVKHVVIRHGLTSDEAFSIECSLLDIFKYMNADTSLTNMMGGHNSIEKGLMTSDEIIRRYNAEDLKKLPDNSIIININKNYKRGNSGAEIYNATKEIWPIGKARLGKDGLPKFKYVLSEYKKHIVEVFEVDEWYSKECEYGKNSKAHRKKRIRYGFNGKIAPEEIRNTCLNRCINKERGASFPIKYKL